MADIDRGFLPGWADFLDGLGANDVEVVLILTYLLGRCNLRVFDAVGVVGSEMDVVARDIERDGKEYPLVGFGEVGLGFPRVAGH